MIGRELEAFVVTASSKSFQKASELLFISSSALIKQINALEEDIGVKLFLRTNKGLRLTEAGQCFYDDTKEILRLYHSAVDAARSASRQYRHPVRIGISQINPYKDFTRQFVLDASLFSSFTTYMVPISSEYKDFTDELRNLGTRVDVIPYFCGHPGLEAVCSTFCLANLPLRVAVPVGHPLSGKAQLTYDDLNHQELITINSEANVFYKAFNEAIEKNAPKAELRPANYYDFTLLNYAASSKLLVLVGDYLKDVHPLLRLVPVAWPHLLPYGIHYAKSPTPAVRMLLDAFAASGISGRVEDAPVVEF